MNFKCILWVLLLFINHVVGEFLQMSLSSVNMSRVIRSISGITITACHMACGKEPTCHDIAITERTPDNQLPTCYLLREDNGHNDEGGNVMTTIQTIGSGVRVDGQWSCWKSISACTVSCGGGLLNQTRDCDSPRPANGGDNCTGPAERTIKCNEQNCPVNGGFGSWGNSSTCSKSCGGGTLEQTRECDSPRPQNGGADCAGDNRRTVECNTNGCPVDGGFGSWRNSSTCSKSYGGGTLEQTRECDSPKPQHGGADCAGDNGRTVECNTNGCPVDGGFGSWKDSSTCSKSCGVGTLEQTRKCDSPKPQHGGADCAGDNRRTVECNTNGCPVNGGFGSWRNSTDCSKSCGNGTLEQTRECDSPKPLNGGADCTGDNRRTVECNTNGCPVHGGWSKWKNSTDCSKPCGNGTLKQRRECDSPNPAYGGDACTGIKERTLKCNTHECPVNVALGKNATQSSTYKNNSKYLPSKAIDGDTKTDAWTGREYNPWWEVDLGDVKVIKGIRLEAYVSGFGFNKGLLVETRTKKEGTWKSCNNFGDVKNRVASFQCHDEITNARFVRIIATKRCCLSFYEVEVIGY